MIRSSLRKLKKGYRVFRWRVVNSLHRRCQCYICGRRFGRFQPWHGGRKGLPPFIREIELVGSDVENFRCPFCLSNDRERHLFLYLDRLDLWSAFKDARIIHFAPERNLSVKIMSCQPRKYVKADLFPADLLRDRVDIERIDVTHINYPNASFDFCICNHVLEHVEDAERALREINRVLRPGGRAVLQTPFSALLHKTIEDPGIMTPHLRLAIYGQDDHARLFGRDFLTTIEKAGLCLQLCPHTKVATLEEAATFGMNPAEDLILVEKGAQLGM